MEHLWMDAELHPPQVDPGESLLLIIGDIKNTCERADMVTGFYVDGEYHIGTTMVGNSLPDDQIVLYWAKSVWSEDYDTNGFRESHQK